MMLSATNMTIDGIPIEYLKDHYPNYFIPISKPKEPKPTWVGNPYTFEIANRVRKALPWINQEVVNKTVVDYLVAIGYKEGRYEYNQAG